MKAEIENFSIKGLFGKKDVSLSFENRVQVYVGENGFGKTTVLNLLYYLLSFKFEEMLKINFVSVSIQIKGKSYDFTKTQIQAYVERDIPTYSRSPYVRFFLANLRPSDIRELKKIIDNSSFDRISKIKMVSNYFHKVGRNITNIPLNEQYNAVVQAIASKEKTEIFDTFIDSVKDLNYKILYFPTYRRIEIDKEKIRKSIQGNEDKESFFFNLEQEEQKNSLTKISQFIHMGMDDFVERKDKLLERISDISRRKLDALSTDIIKCEIQGYPGSTKIMDSDIETVQTLLSRSHIGLVDDDLKKVIEMISNGEVYLDKNKVLLYVIRQLLDIYNSYAIYDRGLKKFVEVCNHYLNDKQLMYDQVALELYIQFNDEQSKSDIGFDLLSSGEKQIISMLAEVYLDPDNNFIFMIDEPELSLSVFWQKMLIPDIMESNRCALLFAVTHSPYIFENEYDNCAVGMSEFVQFNKTEESV